MIDGERIRQLRVTNGYSREKFAELIGVSNTQAYKYESGKSDATGEIIGRMADLFDVTSDYLLGRTDSPDGHDREFTEREMAIINRLLNGKLKDVAQALLGDEKETA